MYIDYKHVYIILYVIYTYIYYFIYIYTHKYKQVNKYLFRYININTSKSINLYICYISVCSVYTHIYI